MATKKPEKNHEEQEHLKHPRNRWCRESTRCLKQARRCEAISYRINVIKHTAKPDRGCPATTVDETVQGVEDHTHLNPPICPPADGGEDDQSKVKMQAKLNSETIHRICKNINKEIKFEEEF